MKRKRKRNGNCPRPEQEPEENMNKMLDIPEHNANIIPFLLSILPLHLWVIRMWWFMSKFSSRSHESGSLLQWNNAEFSHLSCRKKERFRTYFVKQATTTILLCSSPVASSRHIQSTGTLWFRLIIIFSGNILHVNFSSTILLFRNQDILASSGSFCFLFQRISMITQKSRSNLVRGSSRKYN